MLAARRESAAWGSEKSIAAVEGGHGDTFRQHGHDLEKIAHGLRPGQPLDRIGYAFAPGFAGSTVCASTCGVASCTVILYWIAAESSTGASSVTELLVAETIRPPSRLPARC